MKQCPACQRELQEHLLFCPYDGQSLMTQAQQEDADSFVGILFDEKYRIEGKIGEGGMGKVYRATHIHMDHTVAIKILHPHLSSDRLALERFRREARAAAQIRHPNAVAVTDFGVTKDTGTAYLVMEFLEGVDLRDRIKDQKQIGFKEMFNIVQQACAAIHAAHSKSIIHRDLKPDNIWLLKSENAYEQIKVLDFGIAKLKSYTGGTIGGATLTQQGMIVGTPYYMSPEQCCGEELDARSDIYSLGVIIYEMLTGDVPFRAGTPMGVAHKQITEPPRPLHETRPDIPEQVERVILRALSKGRDQRQGSAVELAQELEASLYAAGIELKALGINTPQSPFDSALYRQEQQTLRLEPSGSRAPKPAEATLIQSPGSALDSTETLGVGSESVRATVPSPGRQTRSEAEQQTLRVATQVEDAPAAAGRNRKFYLIAAAVPAVIIVCALAYLLWPRQQSTVPVTPGRTPPVPAGMVRVPGGTFKMGTDDPTADQRFKPARDVTVEDFYLDVNEVTNIDYQRFVRQKGYRWPDHWNDGAYEPGKDSWPVVNITWNDAKAYAAWAGKRLPTEAEWEYAARGPDNLKYPWGNEWATQFSNSAEDGRKEPMAVKNYARGVSWCGVHDMAGNVCEWVEDFYSPYPGSVAPPEPGFRVFRGGAFNVDKEDLLTWKRFFDAPNSKFMYLGFRCAQDVPKDAPK